MPHVLILPKVAPLSCPACPRQVWMYRFSATVQHSGIENLGIEFAEGAPAGIAPIRGKRVLLALPPSGASHLMQQRGVHCMLALPATKPRKWNPAR